MKHVTTWTAMLILVMGVAGPAEAQRSGFIMGFGIGPGVVSYTSTPSGGSSSARSTEFSVATDFHVGGVIGDSFELYFMLKLIFFDLKKSGLIGGIGGVGITYPLSPDFSVSGGIGSASLQPLNIFSNRKSYTEGLGLVAGGGYHLNQRWVLGFDIIYTNPGDEVKAFSVWGVGLTINIVSH